MTDMGKVAEWLIGGDTGVSSKAIVKHMAGIGGQKSLGWDYPHDSDDFGRCYRLLALFPKWRERMPEMAVHSAMWGALGRAWPELTALYEADQDVYAAITRLVRPHEDATGKMIRIGSGSIRFGA